MEKNKKETIFKLAHETLSNTTFHGLPNLARAKNRFQFIVWLSFTLISTCFCVALVISEIDNYFEYEVVTKIRSYHEYKVLFPKVTICTSGIFETEYAYDFLLNITRKNNLTNIFDENLMKKYNSLEKSHLAKNLINQAKIAVNRQDFPIDIKKKFGYSIEDILFECDFNGRPCNVTGDFEWNFDPDYGNCFSHKSENIQFHPGPFKGLYLVVYTSLDERLKPLKSDSGLIVDITNETSVGLRSDKKIILPGYRTELAIKRIFKKRAAKPFSECDIENIGEPNESELYGIFLKAKKKYTQLDCFEMCEVKMLADECNCTRYYMYRQFFRSDLCDSSNECSKRVVEKFSDESFFIKTCLPMCPLECYKYVFEYDVNVYELNYFDTDRIMKSKALSSGYINRSAINAIELKNSLTSLSVYFESFSYELTTESPRTSLTTMFSNIGGAIGKRLNVFKNSVFI